MPTLVKSTAYKSIFDTTESDNQGSNQPNPSSSTQQQQQEQDSYASTRKPDLDLDPEVSSVFTQSTIAPQDTQGASSSSSRFGFLHRKKSSQQQQEALLPTESTQPDKKEKKKSRFENPFKPHEQTEQDRIIMYVKQLEYGKHGIGALKWIVNCIAPIS